MIHWILLRSYREYLRTQRFVYLALAVATLLCAGLATGATTVHAHRRQTADADIADRAVFASQGQRTPHAAAHFGRYAFRPFAPFAIFDPGITRYAGQAVWLEAHTRSPAKLRAAEDAPALSRLADFSVAGVLTLLLPLMVVVIGAPSFAAERAQGTLRQTLSTGVCISEIFAGKLVAVSAVGVVASTLAIGITMVAISVTSPLGRADLARGALLATGYSLYALAFAAVAVAVSARARAPATAQLILLSLWALSVVVVPRAASTTAQQAYPVPDAGQFWRQAQDSVRAERPRRDSDAYRNTKRRVLASALGRPVTETELETMAVNRAALRLEMAEIFGHRAYDTLYRSLYSTYRAQQRIRRWFAIFSPTVALDHFSAALCGTGTDAQRRFSDAAEHTRRAVIGRLNRDMLLNGAGQGFNYTASEALWRQVPSFDTPAPSLTADLRAAWIDLVILAAWAFAACGVAWLAVRSLTGETEV